MRLLVRFSAILSIGIHLVVGLAGTMLAQTDHPRSAEAQKENEDLPLIGLIENHLASRDDVNPGMSESGWANDKVQQKLANRATLKFEDLPWKDVEQYLESQYGLHIVLDQSAKDDSLTDDEPISCFQKSLSLKVGLRLLLREKNATFIVRDGMLMIISLDDAAYSTYWVHEFINVRALLNMIKEKERDRIGKPRFAALPKVIEKARKAGGVFQIGDVPANNNQKAAPVQPKNVVTMVKPVELNTAESLLIDLVHASVHPREWIHSNHGMASCEIIGGIAVVHSTSEVCDDVRSFLQDLEFQMAKE